MMTVQPQIYHALFAVGGSGGEIHSWNLSMTDEENV